MDVEFEDVFASGGVRRREEEEKSSVEEGGVLRMMDLAEGRSARRYRGTRWTKGAIDLHDTSEETRQFFQ